jgi:hypothetical protein
MHDCAHQGPSARGEWTPQSKSDDELVVITNDNYMFKQQARYLVKRRQPELRAQVLVSDRVSFESHAVRRKEMR